MFGIRNLGLIYGFGFGYDMTLGSLGFNQKCVFGIRVIWVSFRMRVWHSELWFRLRVLVYLYGMTLGSTGI